jgi:transcriptional regulator GlxA family with amidase domain
LVTLQLAPPPHGAQLGWYPPATRTLGTAEGAVVKRPLDPFFLKRADRFVEEHVGEAFTVTQLAQHCGVSSRTLQKAFADLRGITTVAHVRNVRLDHAHRALECDGASVAEIAAHCGFKSSTTFALEYRKRFGMAPSRTKRAARSQ